MPQVGLRLVGIAAGSAGVIRSSDVAGAHRQISGQQCTQRMLR